MIRQRVFLLYALFLLLPSYALAEERNKTTSLESGEMLTLPDFPYFIKKGLCMNFHASIETFGKIFIGKGYGQYRGDWLEISETAITHQHFERELINRATVVHGLSIINDIDISMTGDNDGHLHVVLQSDGSTFETTIRTWGFEANHEAFVLSEGSSLSDILLCADNADFRKPVWVCGDSYVGVEYNRWPGCMKEMGYFDFLLNGLAGQQSPNAVTDLKRMLKYGKPEYLLWCLGMNDTDDQFISCLEEVIHICDSLGIALVCSTIPTIPAHSKEHITSYVRARGFRYVDFYKAVETDSTGTWHEGYLYSDNVHPTDLGAQALARQVLLDFLEIKGIEENAIDVCPIHEKTAKSSTYTSLAGKRLPTPSKGLNIFKMSDGTVRKVLVK